MNFGDIKSEYSSNLFNVVRIRENGFSQDAQHRQRKSPRKRLKIARISASLAIEQLKSLFWCSGDSLSYIRMRRNWRPEFLMMYLDDNPCNCNNKCDTVLRHDKRNLVPEVPKIYSIGLHCGARNLSDNDYLSSSCDTIKNLKKRFIIDRRPMITCKYWVTQSAPTTSLLIDAMSFKAHTDRQAMIVDCTESMEIIRKYNQTQESNHNYRHSELYKHVEEKTNTSDISRNDRAIDDHSFIPDDSKDSSVRTDHNCDGSRMTRDAQIQTSNKKNLRRRKIKRKSKQATERISHRKHCNNEPRIVTDFRIGSHNSSRQSHHDEPWLRVRVLENKRAEYINKFTAVNRQIEEITATLRDTCCSSESSRNNLENCDEYFSSISDDTKVNWSGVENKSTIVREKNTSKDKNSLMNIKRIIGELKSDTSENVSEILHVNNLNNETVFSAKDDISSSRKPNDFFGRDIVRAMETVYSSNRISIQNKTKAKCHFIKQLSLDLDVIKNENEELHEFSIKNESFDKVYLKSNFTISNNDKHKKDFAQSSVDFKESRYYQKTFEEKIGEMAILEDIKRRIDRDFDDPPGERSDTEDFFTVSRKTSDFDRDNVNDVSSVTIIEKSKSTPIVATNLEPTEIQIHSSMSVGAMSECSNKNSALSKYFSCTQIPSLVSLTENEDELGVVADDNSSFDCSCSSFEYISRYDPSAQYITPNKSLAEMVNKSDDTFEICVEDRESVAKNRICNWEHPSIEESREKEWRTRKQYTADSTFETSKSSRYIGSIDSGVFSSSLIDLYPNEKSIYADKSKFEKKRRTETLDGPSTVVDSGSDSSHTNDTLDRKVNDVVKDLTKNLILCERRAKMKLRARGTRYTQDILSRAYKFSRNLYDTCCDFFDSSQSSTEDERIISISTPSLLSLSDSEIEDHESKRQRVCQRSNSIQI
ncbi:PREDICTED: uncharacterized protein LOC108755515 isoform X2 [Trachymyrmex septentrionalis]|uniref:uncharacterized protein LOC108755515 isoform X2 n=1 Tax=Trachymyrmex septentrionalis TaxID=34720 RepID=UPI00084F28C1|nr:PREDICTED: uncharacterized protein LOC108755515 isoform X2 [Trachymyrmex septentrionalis]